MHKRSSFKNAFNFLIIFMSVKLGIAPIAWSNDDMPELGGILL